jgi:hypothetical protein
MGYAWGEEGPPKEDPPSYSGCFVVLFFAVLCVIGFLLLIGAIHSRI